MSSKTPFVNPFDAVRDDESAVSSQVTNIPQSLNVILRKVLKKDLKTRVKGFDELLKWISENDECDELVMHVTKIYERYMLDPEHRIRILLHEVVSRCVQRYGKKFFSQAIKRMIFGLIGACYDPVPAVASAAKCAFQELFSRDKAVELCSVAEKSVLETIVKYWEHGIQGTIKWAGIEGYCKEDIEWIHGLISIYINNNLAFLIKNTGRCGFIREHQDKLIQSATSKDAYIRKSVYQLASIVYDHDVQLASQLSSFAFKDTSPIIGDACLDLAIKHSCIHPDSNASSDFPKSKM